MKLGNRAWLVAGVLFIVGIAALAWRPVSSPFLWTYPSAYGPPLAAPDGTIYVNNYNGELVALNPDGSVQWKTFVGKFGIIRWLAVLMERSTCHVPRSVPIPAW